MGKTISFRLRKIDSDLEKAISEISPDQVAELARTGLRVMLGITTTKTTQVVERAIIIPTSTASHIQQATQPQPTRTTIGNAAPTIYKPKS